MMSDKVMMMMLLLLMVMSDKVTLGQDLSGNFPQFACLTIKLCRSKKMRRMRTLGRLLGFLTGMEMGKVSNVCKIKPVASSILLVVISID